MNETHTAREFLVGFKTVHIWSLLFAGPLGRLWFVGWQLGAGSGFEYGKRSIRGFSDVKWFTAQVQEGQDSGFFFLILFFPYYFNSIRAFRNLRSVQVLLFQLHLLLIIRSLPLLSKFENWWNIIKQSNYQIHNVLLESENRCKLWNHQISAMKQSQ